MTLSSSTGAVFNKIVSRFGDELATAPYREQTERMVKLCEVFRARGLPLRVDFARPWENAHVLLGVDRLFPVPAGQRLLDFGGGNSPTSYLLVQRGFDVTVLEVTGSTVDQINRAAQVCGLSDHLRAVRYSGRDWPLPDDAFDCVLSLSVFEGLMPRMRPLFWRELRRVLKPAGSLLMTFDFGPDARLVGDGPATVEEIEEQIIRASGMDLVGAPPAVPVYDPEHGPPVKLPVDTLDGYDYVIAQYSFGAVELRNRQNPDRARPSLAPRARANPLVLDSSRMTQWPELVQAAMERGLEDRLRAARLPEAFSAVGRMELRGEGGGVFAIEISAGDARVRPLPPARPDFVLEMTVEDFVRLFYAGADFWDLFYGASLRARGDIRFAMRIADAFAAD
jgi:SAM-dependent methyltransferase